MSIRLKLRPLVADFSRKNAKILVSAGFLQNHSTEFDETWYTCSYSRDVGSFRYPCQTDHNCAPYWQIFLGKMQKYWFPQVFFKTTRRNLTKLGTLIHIVEMSVPFDIVSIRLQLRHLVADFCCCWRRHFWFPQVFSKSA